MISLLLHLAITHTMYLVSTTCLCVRVCVSPRTSVNNKDIIRMHLGYNWLISQKTIPINASFVKQQAMASGYVHLSKLSLYNKQY